MGELPESQGAPIRIEWWLAYHKGFLVGLNAWTDDWGGRAEDMQG